MGIFLHDKCQVQEKVKIFVRRAQKEFGLPIKKVRSDNGTKFKNTLVEEFLDEEGIKHEFSTPYSPQQNGVVERKNHTLIDMARTMLDEYKTLDLFWCDVVNTTCHAINRLYLHKKMRSDNGTEFKNTLVEQFLDEEGIKHEFLTPYTPQQNGVVERKN